MWVLVFIMIFWVIPAIANFMATLICLILAGILELITNNKAKKSLYK